MFIAIHLSVYLRYLDSSIGDCLNVNTTIPMQRLSQTFNMYS